MARAVLDSHVREKHLDVALISRDVDALHAVVKDLKREIRSLDKRADSLDKDLAVMSAKPSPPPHECIKHDVIKELSQRVRKVTGDFSVHKAEVMEKLTALARWRSILLAIGLTLAVPLLGATWHTSDTTSTHRETLKQHATIITEQKAQIKSQSKQIREVQISVARREDVTRILEAISALQPRPDTSRLSPREQRQLEELLQKAGQ